MRTTGRSWTRELLVELRSQTWTDFAAGAEARGSETSTPRRRRYALGGGSSLGCSTGLGGASTSASLACSAGAPSTPTPPTTTMPTPRTSGGAPPPVLRAGAGAGRRPSSAGATDRLPQQRRAAAGATGPLIAVSSSWEQNREALRRWLLSRYGGHKKAFVALDADRDGLVTPWDVVTAMQRDEHLSGAEALGARDLVSLADGLKEQWHGCASIAEFVEAFGMPDTRLLCLRQRFACGEVAEVGYSLGSTASLGAGSQCTPEVAESAPEGGVACGAGPGQTANGGRPFLCLAPVGLRSSGADINLHSAVAVCLLDLERSCGTARVEIPEDASGPFEWRLFGAPPGPLAQPPHADEPSGEPESGVELPLVLVQLGPGLPCTVDPAARSAPPSPLGPPPAAALWGPQRASSTPRSARGTPRSGSRRGVGRGAEAPQPPDGVTVFCMAAPSGYPAAGAQARVEWLPLSPSARSPRWRRSGATPDGYRVHWRRVYDGGGGGGGGGSARAERRDDAVSSCWVGTEATWCVIGRLAYNAEYLFWIAGVSRASGDGPPSHKVTARTPVTRPSAPGRPSTHAGGSGTSVQLCWAPPAVDGGAPVLSYFVHTTASDGTHSDPLVVPCDFNAFSVDGLRPGVAYTFQVQAVTRVGQSDLSESSDLVVLGVPGEPAPQCEKPAGLSDVIRRAGRPEEPSEEPPPEDAGDVAGARPVRRSLVEEVSLCTPRGDAGGGPAEVAEALHSARSAIGPGRPTSAEAPQAPQQPLGAPPLAPEVTEVGLPTRAALHWQAPDDVAGVPAVVQYVVEARRAALADDAGDNEEIPSAEFGPWERLGTTSRTSHVVTSLEPGAAYQFAVRAIGGDGAESEPSPPSALHCTGPRPPGPPGKPRLCGAMTEPPFDPLLAFHGPAQCAEASPRGGAGLEGVFRAIAFVEGQPELRAEVPLHVVGLDGSLVTAAVCGLAGNRPYQFAVQAGNAGGWGPVGPASSPAFVWRPLAPGKPVAMAATESSVTLSWEATVDEEGRVISAYVAHVQTFVGEKEAAASEPEAYWLVRTTASRPRLACGGDEAPGVPVEVSAAPHGAGRGAPQLPVVSAEVGGLAPGTLHVFRMQADEGQEPQPVSEASDPVSTKAPSEGVVCTAQEEPESEAPEFTAPPTAPEVAPAPAEGPPSRPGRPTCACDGGKCCSRRVVEAHLSWAPSCSASESPVLGYRIHVHRLSAAALMAGGGQLWEGLALKPPWVAASFTKGVAVLPEAMNCADGALPSATLELKAGAAYCMEVQAVNRHGASQASPRSEVLRAPPAPPSACRGLVVRRSGEGDVLLSWQPPDDDGGLPIESYVITSAPLRRGAPTGPPHEHVLDAATAAASMAESGGTPFWLRHILHGLQGGVAHALRVRAANACGLGDEGEAAHTLAMPTASGREVHGPRGAGAAAAPPFMGAGARRRMERFGREAAASRA